jgi:tetratricopeptide (TPR) repeat protein
MKALTYLLVAVLAIFSETITSVSRLNQSVTNAQAAYARRDFNAAIFYYHYLLDSLHVRDRAASLNLAHAYFKANIPIKAFSYYRPLATKTPPTMASLVNLQLGVLVAPDDKWQALEYFKKALIQNPRNEEARYNYELLKKYLAAHPEEAEKNIPPAAPPKPDKKEEAPATGQKEDPQGGTSAETPDFNNPDLNNPPQPNPGNGLNPGTPAGNQNQKTNTNPPGQPGNPKRETPTGSAAGDKEGVRNQDQNTAPNTRRPPPGGREESNEQDRNRQTTYERLREANLSPEKARMLLEALREAEVQYLQQVPRQITRKPDPSKPTW